MDQITKQVCSGALNHRWIFNVTLNQISNKNTNHLLAYFENTIIEFNLYIFSDNVLDIFLTGIPFWSSKSSLKSFHCNFQDISGTFQPNRKYTLEYAKQTKVNIIFYGGRSFRNMKHFSYNYCHQVDILQISQY